MPDTFTQGKEIGLSLKPHNIAPDIWYYEEVGGLSVYVNGKKVSTIPWRKLKAHLARHQFNVMARERKMK